MIKANLAYLAKLEEDPYSNALLEEIKNELERIEDQLMTNHYTLNPHQVFAHLGYKKALMEILKIPENARTELSILPDAEEG